jgi:tRNA(Ile)-lysidine synthase
VLNQVRHILQEMQLCSPRTHLVVAVSGGPDSLCLLHVLWQLRDAGGPTLHVAHLDHCFRGEQSADEARFVGHTAAAWNIPATIEQADIPALLQASSDNKQATARRVRYAFLARVARATAAHAVAVAHNSDDQAETLMLHLLRGAGPAGLRGMRLLVPWHEWNDEQPATPTENAPPLIRPLLETTRAAIEAYCATHHLQPRHDPSNAALHYTRNRIRAELLPHMATYNSDITAALTRTARICSDDYHYIQAQLDAAWDETLVRQHPGMLRFSTSRWNKLHPALQRYALRRAALILTGRDDLSYDLVEAARLAPEQPTGYQQPLGNNLMLRVEYHTFIITSTTTEHPHVTTIFSPTDNSEHPIPQLDEDTRVLAIPGTTPLSETWYAETSFTPPAALPATSPWQWWVKLDASTTPTLFLRRRKPGDVFYPAGGKGTRRLKDFFIDHKIPRDVRAAWPILATSNDEIVWVAGLRADDRFQASATTTQPLWVVLRTTEVAK